VTNHPREHIHLTLPTSRTHVVSAVPRDTATAGNSIPLVQLEVPLTDVVSELRGAHLIEAGTETPPREHHDESPDNDATNGDSDAELLASSGIDEDEVLAAVFNAFPESERAALARRVAPRCVAQPLD
jgi:hypothetical protein